MNSDFEVKNLAEYESNELEVLQIYVESAIKEAKRLGWDGDANVLDIWCYRIRDAKKQSEERV